MLLFDLATAASAPRKLFGKAIPINGFRLKY